MTNFAFRFKQKSFPGGREEISRQLNKLGKISYEEKLVATVFALTAFAWVTRDNLLKILLKMIGGEEIFFYLVLRVLVLKIKHLIMPILNSKFKLTSILRA